MLEHSARPSHTRNLACRPGFSIVEVLVTIGVIGMLLALLLPAVADSREAARRTQCANHLKQIGLALHNYHDSHQIFPPGALFSNELSWHVLILPQMDQAVLYSQFNFNEGQYWSPEVNNKNNPHGLSRVDSYLCPSGRVEQSQTSLDSVDGNKSWTTHYYGIMGPRGETPDGGEYRLRSGFGPFGDQGLLSADSGKKHADVTDGSSNTFVVGEISWNDANSYRTWVRGVNGNPISGCKNVRTSIGQTFFDNGAGFNDISLGSEHRGGTHVLMGDGAVRFLADTIDLITYKAAASIDGGEAETLY
jgi:prepilin-type N-terminal cleavage/methylation domain-containing protein